MLRRVVSQKLTDALMMEAVSTSETSINIYETTQHNIPEDSHLHTARLLLSLIGNEENHEKYFRLAGVRAENRTRDF
jgi:rubrerythrin